MGRPKGGTNNRWTIEDKVRLIEEYYKVDIGYKAFAQEHGIAHSLFCTWLKKYQEGGAEGLRHSKRKVPEHIQQISGETKEILRLKMLIANQAIEIEELKQKLQNDSDNQKEISE